MIVNAIPVTTVARTLVDLTDVTRPPSNSRTSSTRPRSERSSASPRPAPRWPAHPGGGSAILEEALRLHNSGSAGSKSKNEDRFLRLVRGAGLPDPRKNVKVHGFEVDFSWPDLCVEVDGPGHRRKRTKADDRIRDAALKARGITILRFTEDDVKLRPHAVLAELAAQELSRAVARQ